MDWMPTFLEMGGGQPDPSSPLDGISLAPALTRNATPIPRRLFWRYKYNTQQAVRDGDMKYLKIDDNTFLFNVVNDPLERANLKDRQPEVFKRLVSEYQAWNATMLPLDPASYTYGFYADELADHYGHKRN
jgi:arylsulfatase A-like enzyme